MKFLGLFVFAVCVAVSQQKPAKPMAYLVELPQQRQVKPRIIKIGESQIGLIDLMHGNNDVNQQNIGNIRGVNLGGKLSGTYNLDEPEVLELFGIPIAFDSTGNAAANGALHIGVY